MTQVIEIASPWFEYIRDGSKTIEGRKGTPQWKALRKGDWLHVVQKGGSDDFHVEITEIVEYPSLEACLKRVNLPMLLPGITSYEDAYAVYLGYSTQAELNANTFLALHIQKL